MRSNEVPAQTQLRANWLRRDAMVLFTELSEWVLPQLPELVPANAIKGEQAYNPFSSTAHPEISRALQISSLLPAAYLQSVLSASVSATTKEVSLWRYTYETRPSTALYEGIRTVSTFPLQLMEAAHFASLEADVRPLYPDMSSLVRDLRTEWFRDICHVAAFTTNGVWGQSSFEPDRSMYATRSYSGTAPLLDFEFYTENGSERRYRFSDSASAELVGRLRAKNHHHHQWKHERIRRGVPPADETYQKGTSSGCPVRHHEAHYSSTDRSEPSIGLLAIAKALNKTPDELLKPREKTGIDIGLDMVADLLERVVTMEARTVSAGNSISGEELANA